METAKKLRTAEQKEVQESIDAVTRRRILKVLEKPQEFGDLRKFKVANLRSDTTYQRAISERWVKTIARNFDPRLLGVITVGLRGGNENLVDGQHRHFLATQVGIDYLWGIGLHTSSLREEAWLFVELNKNRRTPMGQQLFAAKIVAGDAMAIDINNVVAKFGFKFRDPRIFSMQPALDTITGISVLEKIYRSGGRKRVTEVLQTIRTAWDGDSDSLGKLMIAGMGRFYEVYEVDPKHAGRRFSTVDAFSVLERGRRFAHRNGVSQLDGVVEVLKGLL